MGEINLLYFYENKEQFKIIFKNYKRHFKKIFFNLSIKKVSAAFKNEYYTKYFMCSEHFYINLSFQMA